MFKVLVSDPIADKGIDILKDAGFEVIYEPNLEDAELAALVSSKGSGPSRTSAIIGLRNQTSMLSFLKFSRDSL